MTKKTSAPALPPVVDEHAGMGGSYVVDPETWERTLIERTQAAKPVNDKEADHGTV